MKHIAKILLHLPSYVLHPFWMPTLAMLTFLLTCFPNISTTFTTWAIVGTFISTGLIPLLISILYVRNTADTLEMTDRNSRIAPYIYTSVCYVFWCYFLSNGLSMPRFVMAPALGATVAIMAITLITIWWKISAHTTCFGGVIGAMLGICHTLQLLPVTLIITLFFIAVWLCWSRTYLKAHTPEELACGFLLGLSCTYFTSLLA